MRELSLANQDPAKNEFSPSVTHDGSIYFLKT